MNEFNSLKILIADDEETSFLLISLMLRKVACEFLQAKSGVQAVKICAGRPDIDLVLMDIQMPEMDGYEATRQIRQFNKDVVIIAQTAFAFSGENQKAQEAGCNGYISKPIMQAELIAIVQKYIEKHK